MRVVIYSRILKRIDAEFVQELFDALHENGFSVHVFTPYLDQIRGVINFTSPVHEFKGYEAFRQTKIDYLITLGGDGTILDAVTIVRDSNVPILGINLGRLGFLAGVEKKMIRVTIGMLRNGIYKLDERRLLHLESNIPLFGEMNFALNDCTLLKRDTSSMITIDAFINGAFLNSYWADGIIIATPTGSTGYSLSCGGPIILPHSDNFVITPVAPHNLNVRPIVISDSSIVSFVVKGRAENFLCTLDSRFRTITAAHQLAVRKCDFTISLVRPENAGFLKTLRNKLSWGQDKRNWE